MLQTARGRDSIFPRYYPANEKKTHRMVRHKSFDRDADIGNDLYQYVQFIVKD